MKQLSPGRMLCFLLAVLLCVPLLPVQGAAAEEVTDPKTLYVRDGLAAVFSPAGADLAAGRWTADNDPSKVITLNKPAFFRKEAGALTLSLTLSQYRSGGSGAGLWLSADLLPDSGYTVESVAAPLGLVNEDGTYYVDENSTYGTFHDFGFAMGPMKALAFVTERSADKKGSGELECRWYYQPKGDWYANGCQALLSDSVIGKRGQKLQYVQTFSRKGGNGTFTLYSDGVCVGSHTAAGYAAGAQTDGLYRMWCGYPVRLYAVRIYDRALSQAELAQNRFADLCLHHGLVLWGFSRLTEAEKAALYASFADADFASDAAALQSRIDAYLRRDDAALAGGLIACTEMGLTGDRTGISASFSLREEVVSLLAARYTVRAGVAVGKGKQPSLALQDGEIRSDGDVTLFDGSRLNVLVTPTQTEESVRMYFRPFLLLADTDGKTQVIDYPVQHDFYGAQPSLLSMATALVNRTEGSFAERMTLASDPDLLAILRRGGVTPRTLGEAYTVTATPADFAEKWQEVKALLADTARKDAVITLRLGAGTYRLAAPLTLTAAEVAGNAVLRLEGDGAVFTAATEIPGTAFTEEDGLWVYRFADAPDFRFLWVNGEILEQPAVSTPTRARDNPLRMPFEFGDARVYVPASLVENLTDDDFTTLELHYEIQWMYNILPVTGIDRQDIREDGKYVALLLDKTAFAARAGKDQTHTGSYYWLANAKAYLDEGGEYFCDRAGTLYYKPRSGERRTETTFSVSSLQTLLSLQGVSGVTVQGITFTGCDYPVPEEGLPVNQAGCVVDVATGQMGAFPKVGAVAAESVSFLRVADCTFHDTATDGVRLWGDCHDVTVTGCTFRNMGQSAIRVGDNQTGWNAQNRMYRLTVSGCNIENTGFFIRACCAVTVARAWGLSVTRNTIRRSAYTGISAGWSWASALFSYGQSCNVMDADISYNYFDSFMTEMRDGGAIYVLGGNVRNSDHTRYNRMHHNFAAVTDDCGGGMHFFMPYYHDGSASSWHTYDNVLVNNPDNADLCHFYLQVSPAPAHNITVNRNYVLYSAPYTRGQMMAEWFRSTANVSQDRFETQYDNRSIPSLRAAEEGDKAALLAILATAGAPQNPGRDIWQPSEKHEAAQQPYPTPVLDDTYSSAYVQDGLTAVFEAFSPKDGSVLLRERDGRWYAKNTDRFITLVSPADMHTEQGGVTVALTYERYKQIKAECGFLLDESLLPDADFTVETVLAPSTLTAADGTPYIDSTTVYGTHHDRGFAFCGFKALVFPCARAGQAAGSLECRWYYTPTGVWNGGGYIGPARESAFLGRQGTAFSYTVTRSLQETGAGTFTVTAGAETVARLAVSPEDMAANGQTDGIFQLMMGFPGTVYAVRIYDRVLSDAEKAYNHLIDLFACCRADLALLDNLDDTARQTLAYALYGTSLTAMTAEQLAEKTAEVKTLRNAYDRLYVQEGLVALFTAFRKEDTTADPANGVWVNKMGGVPATIYGGSHFRLLENGGLGYSWSLADWQALSDPAGGNAGIRLSGLLSPEASYTVETVLALDGLTENGQRVTTTPEQYIYGTYRNHSSAFRFGMLHALAFTTYNTGGSLHNRWYWAATDYGTHGFYESGSKAVLRADGNYDGDTFIRTLQVGELAALTARYDRKSSTEGTLTVWGNGKTYAAFTLGRTAKETIWVYRQNADGEPVGDAVETTLVTVFTDTGTERYFLDPDTGEQRRQGYVREEKSGKAVFTHYGTQTLTEDVPITLLGDMPGAAYAVRVYNRLLSDAEQTRNHFVDLCYAFGVDVTGLTLVKEEDLADLCARYGSLTFRDSVRKAEIQQAVDALVRPAAEEQLLAFLGFSTNRSGEEKTLRAVFALEEDALALFARNGEVTLTVLAAPAGEGLDRPEELTEGNAVVFRLDATACGGRLAVDVRYHAPSQWDRAYVFAVIVGYTDAQGQRQTRIVPAASERFGSAVSVGEIRRANGLAEE